jgi:cytochrome c553
MKKILFSLLLGLALVHSSAIAQGDAAAGKNKSTLCAGCHGVTGKNPSPTFPNLAGQHAQYIVKQLKAFKSGERTDPTMAPMAANLSEQDMADLAAYFSSQSRTGEQATGSSAETNTASATAVTKPVFVADAAAGKTLFEQGDEARELGACIGCHGKEGRSNVLIYPNLFKQHPEYIEKQLRAFKEGSRVDVVMNKFASVLTDEEIKNIGAYFADPEAMAKVKAKHIAVATVSSDAIKAGKEKAAVCASCHGIDGNSMVAMYPKLAGQSSDYLVKQLTEFKNGMRQDPIMAGMAGALSEQDMKDLADYFSAQQVSQGASKGNELGKKLYLSGNAERNISACVACHGINGKGMPKARFPVVANQHVDYIKNQLVKFKSANRANDKNGMMRSIAKKLTDKEMQAVAEYMSSL